MSEWPRVSSSHTTLMLPPRSTANCGETEPAALIERIAGAEKVMPPSVERLKAMPRLSVSFSQTMKMLPLVSTASCGLAESAGSWETFIGVEKVKPASVERLYITSRLDGVLSYQATLMLP